MNFFITLRTPEGAEPLRDALPFVSLEAAYLDACEAIPEAAADLLRARRDPFRCAFLISDEDGRLLMEVPLTEALRSAMPTAVPGPSRPTDQRVRHEVERLATLTLASLRQHERSILARRESQRLLDRG